MTQLRVRPTGNAAFHARLTAAAIGQVEITEAHSTSVVVEHIQGVGRELREKSAYLLHLQRTGRSVARYEGRETVLEPGDLFLCEASAPCGLELSENNAMLVLKMPRQFLDRRTPVLDLALNRSIKGGLSVIAGELLTSLWEHRVRGMNAGNCETVLALAGDLVATALAEVVGADGRSGAQLRLLLAARRHIEAHLAESGLTPGEVADRLGVSRRYLHKAFAGAGETFSHYVKARRLERCHLALVDPLQASRSIAAIAYGWGFSDARHFARLFRATYGRSPAESRSIHFVQQ